MNRFCAFLLVAVSCVAFSRAGEEEGLTLEMTNLGPESVKWNGESIWNKTRFRLKVKGENGKRIKFEGNGSPAIDEKGIVKRVWPEITVLMHWAVKDDRIRLDLKAINTSAQTFGSVSIVPLSVKFPRRPQGSRWFWGYDMFTDNEGEPGIVAADWGGGKMIVCCEDLEKPCKVGFQGNFGNSKWNLVHIATAESETLAPGAERTWTVSFRFAPAGTPNTTMAADVYQEFGKRFPYILDWDDRRPIGAIFMARSGMKWKTNPRGWMNDKKIDVTTEAGRKDFGEKLMKYADKCISEMTKVGAQGMIFWDVEGGEMPHPFTYLGDPRVLPQAAPEMDEYADAFFKKFLDAGLKTGVCIRPSRIIPNPKGGWKHQQVDDPVAEMADKIAYAKKRWGCTIFYMDTNVTWKLRPVEKDQTRGMWQGDAALLASRDLYELKKRHPDVLIFPEFGRFGYYSCCMPYGQLKTSYPGVPAGVRDVWPEAGRTLNVGDSDVFGLWDKMLEGAMAGDILVFRGWFGDKINRKIMILHKEVALKKAAAEVPHGDFATQLADPAEAVRLAAVTRVEKPDAAQTALLLERLKAEKSWVVKRNIVVALGRSGSAEAVPALVTLLEKRKGNFDNFAADALTEIGQPATPALSELLSRKDGRVVRLALNALKKTADPMALPAILKLSESKDKGVRKAAAGALGCFSTPASTQRLIAMIEGTRDKGLLRTIARALGRTGNPAAIEPLVELIEASLKKPLKDNGLRATVGHALEKLTGKQHGPYERRWRKAFDKGELAQ